MGWGTLIGLNWLRSIQMEVLVSMKVSQNRAGFVFGVDLLALVLEAAGTSETLVYI
jgi:hypothetical protein